MNNDELIRQLMNDNEPEEKLSAELSAQLDSELNKPEEQRDYDRIAGLSAELAQLHDAVPGDDAVQNCIDAVNADRAASAGRMRIRKWLSAAAACLAVIFALNAYTMLSFGEGFISTVVKYTQNGFTLDFTQDDPPGAVIATDTAPVTMATELRPTPVIRTTAASKTTAAMTESTRYPVQTPVNAGDIMYEHCGEYGFKPCRLELALSDDNYDFSYERNELSEDFYFTFMSADKKLDIIIEKYSSKNDIPLNLIPSANEDFIRMTMDNFSSGDQTICYLFSEDDNSTAVFVYDNAVYTVVCRNMSAENMKSLINSSFAPPRN